MRPVPLPPAPSDSTRLLSWCKDMIAAICRASNIDTAQSVAEAAVAFATPVALTDAATVSWDWTEAENFTLTVSGSRTLGNPSNPTPGQWRTINVAGNNASARTLSFGTQFSSGKPTLTDITSTKTYLIEVYCITTTLFFVRATNSSP